MALFQIYHVLPSLLCVHIHLLSSDRERHLWSSKSFNQASVCLYDISSFLKFLSLYFSVMSLFFNNLFTRRSHCDAFLNLSFWIFLGYHFKISRPNQLMINSKISCCFKLEEAQTHQTFIRSLMTLRWKPRMVRKHLSSSLLWDSKNQLFVVESLTCYMWYLLLLLSHLCH